MAKGAARLPALPHLILRRYAFWVMLARFKLVCIKLVCIMLVWIMLGVGQAWAHKASDAYLTLRSEGASLHGRWDIALRDLDFAMHLDADNDGIIRWGEVDGQQGAIAAMALSQVQVKGDGRVCPLALRDLLIDRHSDGAYAVLMLQGQCPAAPAILDFDYQLFADFDPLHRGLLHVQAAGGDHSLVLGGPHPAARVALTTWGLWGEFKDFLLTGIWHIWTGYDHLLFLISLLLPAVLQRDHGRWRPQTSLRATAIEVVKVVSAFTLAHSLTLSMAALGVVSLPSRLTESLIAASVVLAAANNLRPLMLRRVWLVAFGFGLIHGFGFANVLHDLDLTGASLLRALLAFNLGVETGQLAVVALFLPLAWMGRAYRVYISLVLQAGSALIVLLALLWLVQRAFDLSLSLP